MKKITTSIPNIDFDVPDEKSYLPDSVTRYVRHINEDEFEILRSVFGFFGAKKVKSEVNVEVLHVKAINIYYLNPCGPGCCPPQLLFQINHRDYLYITSVAYSHGLNLFADEQENLKSFFENLLVVRSEKSHLPIQILGTGKLLSVKEIEIRTSGQNELLVFTANLEGQYCTFLRSNELPEALKDKLISI